MKKKLSATEVEEFVKDVVISEEQQIENDLTDEQKAMAWEQFGYEMRWDAKTIIKFFLIAIS